MGESTHSPRMVRFGVYEVDLRAGELRRSGVKIKLQEQPFQILSLLLERPGEVVTREEIQKKLWPADTFVDFEHSLNAAIKRLREALGDSADNPRFVETLPRRGYRFIYPVEGIPRVSPAAGAAGLDGRRIGRRAWLAALGLLALAAVVVGLNVGGLRDKLLGRPAPGEITSIAVLPLENLSGDPEQEYFVDGMTETLITELSKIGALKVISRQSVMQFKGTEKSLPEIARELNVDAVVQGSALHIGERVRITVQLIEAATDRNLWAENYDRDLTDVLALHSEVAQAIAREVKIAVTPEEETRLADARPVNPEAYRLYLLGRFFWNKRRFEANRKAIEYFEQAIALDPDYALAYAGHADAHLFFVGKEHETKGRAAAKRALEIDPRLGEAHASLGYDASYVRWDWADAEQHFRRAIELSPNYAFAYLWYGSHLSRLGRFDEALNKTQRALELDPLSIVSNRTMGARYYDARDYEEAIKSLKKTIEMDPTHDWPHLFLGLSYLQMERFQEAIEELQEADALDRGPDDWPGALAAEARAHAAIGKIDEARELVEKIIKIGEQDQKELEGYFPSYSVAQGYVALGQLDRVFEWLERAYRERDWRMISIGIDPAMDPLRSDPRFEELLRRMNFPG